MPVYQRLLQLEKRARNVLTRLDSLFVGHPERGAVARAMLLGDRSFVDSSVVLAFQKTAAYHVLVVAGLHVGALRRFFSGGWSSGCDFDGRDQRDYAAGADSRTWEWCRTGHRFARGVDGGAVFVRAAAFPARGAFEHDRHRCVRSSAMETIVDSAIRGFQLSFVAASVIAGLALPWMERSSAPYRAGLNHLGDVTRDTAHAPKIAQFRIEMRAAVQWLANRMPVRLASRAGALLVLPVRAGLRLWEIVYCRR